MIHYASKDHKNTMVVSDSHPTEMYYLYKAGPRQWRVTRYIHNTRTFTYTSDGQEHFTSERKAKQYIKDNYNV